MQKELEGDSKSVSPLWIVALSMFLLAVSDATLALMLSRAFMFMPVAALSL